MGEYRLMPLDPLARVEVRRVAAWFAEKFAAEVSEHLVREKIYKRLMPTEQGGGPPESSAIHAARANIRSHLKYIGWLARSRNWLAGERLTYADLAAAAHLSVVDYLGDVPWHEEEMAKTWYARVKSRPAFRPLLAEVLPGLPPSPAYADLDF
jgi:glutathione S-transferase